MTHEHTEPHYIDHSTRRGLKLRAMFSTDNFGRNTLELVCPDLRAMDTDTAEGFIEVAKDRVKETMSAMRKASPTGKIDCYLISPKPGYKLDRITLKGDNELLLKIAEQYGELHMGKAPSYQATHAFKAIADGSLVREVEHSSPDRNVTFAIQVKPQYRHLPQKELTAAINDSGKANGVVVEDTRPYDARIGALYINGPLEHAATVATEFGSRCASNIKCLIDERSPA